MDAVFLGYDDSDQGSEDLVYLYQFSSEDNNIRVVPTMPLKPFQDVDLAADGAPERYRAKAVAVPVGPGLSFVHVLKVPLTVDPATGQTAYRLIIGNGVHRVFRLLELGNTHAAAVVQTLQCHELPETYVEGSPRRAARSVTAEDDRPGGPSHIQGVPVQEGQARDQAQGKGITGDILRALVPQEGISAGPAPASRPALPKEPNPSHETAGMDEDVLEEGCYYLHELGLTSKMIAERFEISAKEVDLRRRRFERLLKSGEQVEDPASLEFWRSVQEEAEGNIRVTFVSGKGFHHAWRSDMERMDGPTLLSIYESCKDFLNLDPNARFLQYEAPKNYDPLAMQREIAKAVVVVGNLIEQKWKAEKRRG